MMKKINVKKLAAAGLLIALGVVCSAFYIPIGASRCFPVQHAVNVLAAVLLGPFYGTGMAFCTSLFRVMMGTGSWLAFPGSMAGALVCGLLYAATKKLSAAFIGEAAGTGILGALLAYPVALLVMGKEGAVFAYVLPFLISSAGGAFLSVCFIHVLTKTKVLENIRQGLKE